jgi:3-deoxy-D-arabino-heptulosonate 7-phosphate (DAHP) synthase
MKIFAGPCALLNDAPRMVSLAMALKDAGADVFRAGVRKGGTFPPSLGSNTWGVGYEAGRDILTAVREVMPVTTEVREVAHMETLKECMAYFWTPARQMQVYDTMRDMAKWCADNRAILMVKRGPGNTMREVKGIIEHIKQVGYPLERLWIIERGIVGIGYTEETRWRPDLLLIPELKDARPEVRVCVDCSHSVGRREFVDEVAMGATAMGADGLMIEVMDNPEDSPSDARQTVDIEAFTKIVRGVKDVKRGYF